MRHVAHIQEPVPDHAERQVDVGQPRRVLRRDRFERSVCYIAKDQPFHLCILPAFIFNVLFIFPHCTGSLCLFSALYISFSVPVFLPALSG